MKKPITLFLLLALLINLCISTSALSDENGTVIYLHETDNKDGYTIIDKVILHPQLIRTNTRAATHSKTVYREGILIAEIAYTATFRYDGTTVSVVSKAVTQTDTYDGWKYNQKSFASRGNTVTLEAKLTKLLIYNIPLTMSLSCDTDGNITPA